MAQATIPQVLLDAFAKMSWPLNKNVKTPKQANQS